MSLAQYYPITIIPVKFLARNIKQNNIKKNGT